MVVRKNRSNLSPQTLYNGTTGRLFMSLLLILPVLILAAFAVLLLGLSALRYIPNNRIGIVEKRASRKGSVKTGLMALAGEAGSEPRVLRGGWHFLPPFQYR